MATVQKREITHEQISSLFWINVAASALIALVTVAMAPAIAWFYGEPRLTMITISLTLVFLFGGLTVQHHALLQRQMRFKAIESIKIISLIISICAAIFSATFGAGYWALIIMQCFFALGNAVGVWVLCDWRPSRPMKASGLRGMISFGANLTGFNIMNYFARNLDNLLIGKVWGPASLGFYSKAYLLLLLPINQITAPIRSVAIPALSSLQKNPKDYSRFFYRAINVIAFITMPIIMILAALAHDVILLVFGTQWVEVAPIFKVLAFAGLLQPVVNPVGWVFISLGQTNRMFHWALFSTPVTIISFFLGLPWGAIGVAVSYTIIFITIVTFPCLWWAFRESPISILGWFKSVQCPLIGSLCMYGIIEMAHHFLSVYKAPWGSIIAAVLGIFTFIVIVLVWAKARKEILETLNMLRHLQMFSHT